MKTFHICLHFGPIVLFTFVLCSVTRFGDFFCTLGNFLKALATINFPNLPHFQAIFVKVSKSIIFLVKSFLGTFIDIWQFFLVTLVVTLIVRGYFLLCTKLREQTLTQTVYVLLGMHPSCLSALNKMKRSRQGRFQNKEVYEQSINTIKNTISSVCASLSLLYCSSLRVEMNNRHGARSSNERSQSKG